MTILKKVILATLTLLSLVTTSCSSDDENPDADPIVGTWLYTKVIVDGIERPLSDCEIRSVFVFNADGKAADNFYEEFQSKCVSENTTGTWKKNVDGTYTGTFTDEIEDYTIEFEIINGELVIEDTFEPIIDIYRK